MHLPALIQDLAVILGVAAVVTFLFRRIRQPVVLGYIIAGVVVGPYTPAVFSVTDTASIKVWAELGVIFLMFSLGLEFSFRRLARVGMSAGVTAAVQIVAMLALGLMAATLLNWSSMDAVFLGCMIAISSTTIIIKALEELNLHHKKFAELVFGILIVEDLAAILMLVALTSIATTSQIGGFDLLIAGFKLALVVGAWFVIGMFLVPRFISSVSKHGNDEMLTVLATGLCLGLVALAARNHYSAALGAFIMGSILAESSEVKRVEHLVRPLKDIFGAVFFVSVGMLLDPKVIVDQWAQIAVISGIIISGKLLSVTLGALATGQTVKTSVQTGFSMAQIGEFSFIIAALGMSYGVIGSTIYPIIVASSLITTFTTPYLIKNAGHFASFLESSMPSRFQIGLQRYSAWMQRRTMTSERRKAVIRGFTIWSLNGVVVFTAFALAAKHLLPFFSQFFANQKVVVFLAWIIGFVVSAPSLWAMVNAFRDIGKSAPSRQHLVAGTTRLASAVFTIVVLGLVSIDFFPALETMLVTSTVGLAVLIVFRRQIGVYYRWLEQQFHSGFQSNATTSTQMQMHERLAPWDAHLIEVKVPTFSKFIGRTLQDLRLRDRFELNVVVMRREGLDIVAPSASETLYPGDVLLCFATDTQIERFKEAIEEGCESKDRVGNVDSYDLMKFTVTASTKYGDVLIRDSGIREEFGCILVGLERKGERVSSPVATMKLQNDDILWVVGEDNKLRELAKQF